MTAVGKHAHGALFRIMRAGVSDEKLPKLFAGINNFTIILA
jgi:hypothetical protein